VTDLVIILTTVPVGDRGEAIARAIVEGRLAACVNLSPPMRSLYHWNGRLERDEECQLVIKTRAALVDDVRSCVRALHPYELPEWLVLPILDASPEYADWVRAETGESGTSRTR
jgi:periplasmic divalent cation tolerance protein